MTEKRNEFTTAEGLRVIRDTLPDTEQARAERDALEEACPSGWHLWLSRLKRARRGRRCDIEVQYRPDEPPTGRRGEGPRGNR